MSDPTPIIEIRDITKRFGGIVAVDGVSFDVFPGEILGVIGPNGCGKSTLFNCVLGQYVPDHGTVEVRGVDDQRCGRPLERRRR